MTVKWIYDSEADPTYPDDGTRVRKFLFFDFKIQVWTGTGGELQIMRCDNLDGPIEVKVVTAL